MIRLVHFKNFASVAPNSAKGYLTGSEPHFSCIRNAAIVTLLLMFTEYQKTPRRKIS